MGKTKSPPKPATQPAEVRAPAPPAPEKYAGTLPLTRIRPSPDNPRKTFDGLEELAASIRANGLLQRILVRPIGPAPRNLGPGKGWSGVDYFEVVCGERRFRALALAGAAEAEVDIRVLTDAQARPLRHVENEQRADVRLSETAAAYATLAETLTAEQIAATVGKPTGYVRGLVRLARLPAWALAAVDAGTLPRATAELVARVPGAAAREKAAAQVLTGTDDWGTGDGYERTLAKLRAGKTPAEIYHNWDGPKSYREAKEALNRDHTRQLKGAPFSLKVVDLVPEAGSCEACPSRAGNDPEAKADGVRADVCLDPDCYRAKVEAYRAGEVAKAAAKGVEEADLGVPSYPGLPPRGWIDVAGKLGDNPDGLWERLAGNRHGLTVRDALKGTDCPLYIAFGPGGKAVTLAKTAEARKALTAAGMIPKPERAKPAAKKVPFRADETFDPAPLQSKADPRPPLIDTVAAEEKAAAIGARVLGEMAAGDCGDVDAAAVALRMVARFLIRDHCEFGPERRRHVAAALGFDPETAPSGDMLYHEAAEKLDPADVLGLCVRLAAAPVLDGEGGATRGFGHDLLEWGQIDWPQLLDQARRELAGGPTADERIAAAEVAQVAGTAAAITAPQLLDLDVPAAVLDLLDARQLHGVAETWATCQDEMPEVASLPPRNRLMAWLVRLGAKAKQADQAAGVIAAALPDGDRKEGAA